MTYDQLVTLEAIVNEGSFKSASDMLHKTQPSLSTAIKKLEQQYDLKLFSREKYRPELTEVGKAFYKKAQIALEAFRELDTFAKELSSDFETELLLTIDAICPLAKISPTLETFFANRNSVSFNLQIDLLEGITEKILEHKVDFGIGSYMVPSESIEAVKVFDTSMVPVISPKFDVVNTKLLKELPQIVVRSSAKQPSRHIVGMLNGAKSWYTSDMYMKEQLIENGLGWGRLPFHQIKEKLNSKNLVQIETVSHVEAVPVPLYLLRSRTKTLGPHAKALWAFLLEACKN